MVIGCTSEQGYTPKNLTKLSNDQVMEMAINKSFPNPQTVVYKSPTGVELSLDSLGKITNIDDFFQVYYKNATGEIKEVIVKTATPAEMEFSKKLIEAFNKG